MKKEYFNNKRLIAATIHGVVVHGADLWWTLVVLSSETCCETIVDSLMCEGASGGGS